MSKTNNDNKNKKEFTNIRDTFQWKKFEKAYGNKDGYKFVQNRSCPFFPCHKDIPIEKFNCLFCYCPLYALGDDCGGNPIWLENGVKDCSQCTLPHIKQNYDLVIKTLAKLIKKTQK